MRFNKIITLTVDIDNWIKIYSTKEGLLNLLIEHYESKCFGGIYIEKINRIVRRTECRINQNCDGGIGTTAVICEVTAITFTIGEVITHCKIQMQLKDEMLIGGPKIAKISLIAHTALKSIDVGKIIPVRVAGVKYNPFSEIVSIVAVPYLPSATFTVYKCGKVDNMSLLDDVLAKITEEETLRKALDPNAIEIFENLLYAYKLPQTPSGELVNITKLLGGYVPSVDVAMTEDVINTNKTLIQTNKASINEISINGLYIGRDPRMKLTSPYVSTFNRADMIPEGITMREDIDPIYVLLIIFNDYYNNLRICREMIEIYSTDEMIKSHAALWLVLKKNKV